MDFTKLREYTDNCNKRLNTILETNDIDIKYLKRVCQEIGFQTQYTYSEAIDIVSNELANGLDINKIILKYNLEQDLI